MDQKKIVYWWTGKEEYEFKDDHKGECEDCGAEATLSEDNVCEDCHIISMNEDEDF
ncbi:hypothetical protein ACFPYJ_20175 [Paenibacillus solisilvae]|uniref:YhfH family protein n=1 Tax=Paenibacillus solisilvae TaxID=2486751 RepID=A0ABW0W3R7_9BACL